MRRRARDDERERDDKRERETTRERQTMRERETTRERERRQERERRRERERRIHSPERVFPNEDYDKSNNEHGSNRAANDDAKLCIVTHYAIHFLRIVVADKSHRVCWKRLQFYQLFIDINPCLHSPYHFIHSFTRLFIHSFFLSYLIFTCFQALWLCNFARASRAFLRCGLFLCTYIL